MLSELALAAGFVFGASEFSRLNFKEKIFKEPHIIKFPDGNYGIKTISCFIPLYVKLDKVDDNFSERYSFSFEKDFNDKCKSSDIDEVKKIFLLLDGKEEEVTE